MDRFLLRKVIITQAVMKLTVFDGTKVLLSWLQRTTTGTLLRRLSGVVVSVLVTGPEGRGFNPG
jgi:hypothetical protein